MKNIELFYEDIIPLKLRIKIVKTLVNILINNEVKELGNIAIVFCSDDYLLSMNKQYLNHDYYTDIIAFDYVEENRISGDL